MVIGKFYWTNLYHTGWKRLLLDHCVGFNLPLFGYSAVSMANSRFEYVRCFEEANDPILLRNCFIVVRIDGQNFHQFSKVHNFYKPNDKRALDLMVEAAKSVLKSFYPAIKIAYGQSDEFSFIFSRSSDLYKRRSNKLISLIVSTFTSSYVYHWSQYMKNVDLKYPPAFDGRCVVYPGTKEIIDYLKWRQVDCHINNLYNTTFYCLTGEYNSCKIDDNGETIFNPLDNAILTRSPPLNHQEAQIRLKGTVSRDKHDIMFLQYGVNYNNEMEQFKKGSLIILEREENFSNDDCNKKSTKKRIIINPDEIKIKCLHVDTVKSSFWDDNNHLLE